MPKLPKRLDKLIKFTAGDEFVREHLPSKEGLSGGAMNKVNMLHRMGIETVRLQKGDLDTLSQDLHWIVPIKASTIRNDFIPFLIRFGCIRTDEKTNSWISGFDNDSRKKREKEIKKKTDRQ